MHVHRTAALAAAAIVVSGTGLGVAQAAASTASPLANTSFKTVAASTGQWDVSGSVLDSDGDPLDDVSVEAFKIHGDAPVASSITYGGEFDLYLDSGRYRITVTDLDGVYPSLVVSSDMLVKKDRMLGETQMLFPAPRSTRDPVVKGRAVVGEPLSAKSGVWDTDGLSFSYTWTTGGQVVGNRATYTPSAADVGKSIRVTVTAESDGAKPGTASSALQPVAKAPSSTIVKSAKVRARQVTLPVEVRGAGGLKGLVVVREVGNTRVLSKVATTGKGAWAGIVNLSGVSAGQHRYTVTFTGSSGVADSAVRSEVVRVK